MKPNTKNAILILSPLIFVFIFLAKTYFHWSELPAVIILRFDSIGMNIGSQSISQFIITTIMLQSFLGLLTSFGVWFTIYHKKNIFPTNVAMSIGNFLIGLITGISLFLIEKNAKLADANLISAAILSFGGIFYSLILCDKFEEKN
ncbi:MAG: hypothetical protein DWQ06_11530 [Calditrichaeota bacterium]|nr:MAG: hypothetical protein DWQ06_11530 [Calditrichota bacterium]